MNYSSDDLLFAGAIILIALVLSIVKRFAKPPLALQQWASQQGFSIVRSRYRQFARGPFAAASVTKEQDVYEVIILTHEGTQRAGWVRCNYATAAERVEIAWNDESPKPALPITAQAAR